jgi:hypothetical protein
MRIIHISCCKYAQMNSQPIEFKHYFLLQNIYHHLVWAPHLSLSKMSERERKDVRCVVYWFRIYIVLYPEVENTFIMFSGFVSHQVKWSLLMCHVKRNLLMLFKNLVLCSNILVCLYHITSHTMYIQKVLI